MTSSPQKASLFDHPDEQTLTGRVDRIVYSNPRGGWAVIRLVLSDSDQKVTAVGLLAGVQPGERLRLSGVWEQDRKFGRQFRVAAYLSLLPTTAQGIERFLGSGLIPGIGPVMAGRLVDRFGLETLEIIAKQPDRLIEVKGIGRRRAAQIQQAWDEQRGVREVMIFLQGHGISFAHALRIQRAYGRRAAEIIRSNPYRLSEDLFGFGFQTADRIAARFGIAPNSSIRAAAGLLHSLGQAERQGHVFLPQDQAIADTATLLEQPEEIVQSAVTSLVATRRLIREDPLGGERSAALYRPRLHRAETSIARRLHELLAAPHRRELRHWRIDLQDFERRRGIELSARQRDAVGRSLVANVLVITGGPGTGKTTLTRAVVDLLGRQGRQIALAAPTGRAAKRLSEATGLEARTLHRLLEFDPRGNEFKRHAERPLETDVVIVDEVSMLDCSLAWHLLEAIPDGCRLILIGDVDQLPSVGPGRVLADLIDSGSVPVVRLQEVFRQATQSLIIANAHRIRQGLIPRAASSPESDFFVIERREPGDILTTIDHLIGERIPRSFGFDPRTEIQLLAPMRRGDIGVDDLNIRLQSLLAADAPPVEIPGCRFRQGDRVMQIRNNYELDVFNGDIGHVIGATGDGRDLRVDFYGAEVIYPQAEIDQLVLAYACSIHKAQGSEYPCVILPLHSQHHIMLQRNLLYTAVTRGRQLVIIVGEPRALARAVRNDRQQVRHTRLRQRLAAD